MFINAIEQGSAIPEPLDVDDTAEEFFDFPKPNKILIVEGDSDKQALDSFIYLNKMEVNFSIRTAQAIDDENRPGKKIAIDYYEKNKINQSIRLLIDRDYDFICSFNHEDENIFYYDFYELENYLFDEESLKRVLLANNLSLDKIKEIQEFLFSNKSEILLPLIECSKLRIFRELHKVEKTSFQLSQDIIKNYALFVSKLDIKGCLLGRNPELVGNTFEERLNNYLKYQLDNIDSDLYITINKELDNLDIKYPDTILDFLRYFYKGKDVIKFVPELLKYYGSTENYLSDFSSSKLLNIFIFNSPLYKQKIMQVCASF